MQRKLSFIDALKKQRKTWGDFSPVTRIKQSKKKYSRKGNKKWVDNMAFN